MKISLPKSSLAAWLMVSVVMLAGQHMVAQTIAAAQAPQWQIISPLADSVVENENLLVSVQLNNYQPSPEAQVYLDNVPLPGMLKISDNRINFVYFGFLRDGLHRLTIKSPAGPNNNMESLSWNFYVNNRQQPGTNPPTDGGLAKSLSVEGSLVADNRSTSLSGKGQALRQEPNFTRSAALNMRIKWGNAQIPVRLFATTDNRFTLQSSNYFQTGFHNRWLQLDVGDLNPNLDRLVLSGVRVTGASLKVKMGKNSVTAFYGNLVQQPIEGLLQNYVPGAGFLPPSFTGNNQYITPGIYKRWITGGRAEVVMFKENLTLGFTGIKAKDRLNSIRYGINPKDNLAGGVDAVLRLFKKQLTLSSGLAGSLLTNDIKGGVFDKETYYRVFGGTTSYNPADYADLLVINTSTIPADYKYVKDGLAWYGQLDFTNKYQSFSVDYRNIGALYNSLGNPFLRNNYEGISFSERLFLIQRKLQVNLNYQRYNNNTNNSLQSSIASNIFNGGVIINPGVKYPVLVLNYMLQTRQSSQEVRSVYQLNDRLGNYLANISYKTSFWGLQHNLRAFVNYNRRIDKVQAASEVTYLNYMAGINEGITKTISLNADFGQTIIKNSLGQKLSSINTYSFFVDWQSINRKAYASAGLSNNQVMPTLMSVDSYKMAAVARMGYYLNQAMQLDLEISHAPYREKLVGINNYTEQYIYLRYQYNFNFR